MTCQSWGDHEWRQTTFENRRSLPMMTCTRCGEPGWLVA